MSSFIPVQPSSDGQSIVAFDDAVVEVRARQRFVVIGFGGEKIDTYPGATPTTFIPSKSSKTARDQMKPTTA